MRLTVLLAIIFANFLLPRLVNAQTHSWLETYVESGVHGRPRDPHSPYWQNSFRFQGACDWHCDSPTACDQNVCVVRCGNECDRFTRPLRPAYWDAACKKTVEDKECGSNFGLIHCDKECTLPKFRSTPLYHPFTNNPD